MTVIVLAYNHEKYVGQALDSVFSQTYENYSVVIVDDASPDNTADVVRRHLAGRQTAAFFIEHEVNRGVCASLNDALAHCAGDYVAMISADDWMEPTRLQTQVDAMVQLGPEYGVCYSDSYNVDEHGQRMAGTFIGDRLGSKPRPSGDVFLDLLQINFIPPHATLIRTSVYRAVGNYDESLLSEDYDMWLRMSRRFKFAYVPGCIVSYRHTPNSLTDAIFRDNRDAARCNSISTLRKHLGAEDALDRAIVEQLRHFVILRYWSGVAAAEIRPDLRLVARYRCDPTTVLYFVAAVLRVPGSSIYRLRERVRRAA